jgi:hypothetical protein
VIGQHIFFLIAPHYIHVGLFVNALPAISILATLLALSSLNQSSDSDRSGNGLGRI